MFTSRQLRKKYIDFFATHGHAEVESSSTVPHKDDQTVLFTTAGMQQFVPNLMGKPHPKGTRLSSVQKCVRTVDIDEVGDNRHLTLFEMLGNWSLGDYFKKEALTWSWEFLTKEACIAPERIWVTVFGGDKDIPLDTDAEKIWLDLGVPKERIVPIGPDPKNPKKGRGDNFWGPAGPTGPCGPCSEMHIWIGEGQPKEGQNPANDDTNFVEVWNDVFMEFYSDENGQLSKLDKQNVDTGMGLERLTMILNNKKTVFETDVYAEILAKIEDISKKQYPPYHGDEDEKNPTTRAFRVIADHIRTATHIIADGIAPSNEGRGYVLRRLIRRAVRYGAKLGITETFLSKVASSYIDAYSCFYPEIAERKQVIFSTLTLEEEQFLKTLERGEKKFEEIIANYELQMNKNTFIFVRHGESVDNAKKVLQHGESPLSSKGKEHAEKVFEEIKGKNITKILSSPTTRAFETAQIVAKKLGLSIEILEEFESAKMGDVAGTPKEKVLPLSPLEYAEKMGTGETYIGFFDRVKKGVEKLKNLPKGKGEILVVAHRGVFSAMDTVLNGGSVEDAKTERRNKENAAHGIWSERTLDNSKFKMKNSKFSGADAFLLSDTYGFPKDLTRELAQEKGFEIDEEIFDTEFEEELKAQRERSRANKNFDRKGSENAVFEGVSATEFVGYEMLESEAKILKIVDDAPHPSPLPEGEGTLRKYRIVFDKTPFYAESGGQVGDRGEFKIQNEKFNITDVKKLENGVFVHYCISQNPLPIPEGEGIVATLVVDATLRARTARHHSAAHLLQGALQQVLGNHIEQAGSLVDENRTRFDFSHPKALSTKEILEVQKVIAKWVLESHPVTVKTMPIADAKAQGAVALFSEKYGDTVRTIKMGDVSFELCGGTHVSNTSEIGAVQIISETSVASGIRRIEMVVGASAQELLDKTYLHEEEIANRLKCTPVQILERLEKLFAEKKEQEDMIRTLEKTIAENQAQTLFAKAQNGVLEEMITENQLPKVVNIAKALIAQGLVKVVLITEDGGIVVATAKDGEDAREVFKQVQAVRGGNGGGSPTLVQGKGVSV